MAFIVLGILLVLTIIGAIVGREFAFLFIGLAVSLCASMLVGIIIDGPVNWIQREKTEQSHDLAALNDGSQVQGSFFLGSGTIDSVPSFMYYAKVGSGYRLYDWPASSSEVVETNDKPRVVFYCDDYSDVWLPFRWSARAVTEDGSYIDCNHAFATFYVPPGSVKQQYTLDAQ